MRTMISPPYNHLPTSISTSLTDDPTATTTTENMPEIGTSIDVNGVTYTKDHLGWIVNDNEPHYADVCQTLLLEGWSITKHPRTGDICLGTLWLTPPRNTNVPVSSR